MFSCSELKIWSCCDEFVTETVKEWAFAFYFAFTPIKPNLIYNKLISIKNICSV